MNTKQDYFTRDKGKVIEHGKVGSEIRLDLVQRFRKGMKESKKAYMARKMKEINIKH